MPDPRPELIFLAGPQAGERAVLMSNVAVLGRAPTAEVLLKEEFTSRQHVRFELTMDGWVVENLSSHGMRINGKAYKTGKKLILDTGDLVGVGMVTEMLFVAPGDDPEEALKAYREKAKVDAANAVAASEAESHDATISVSGKPPMAGGPLGAPSSQASPVAPAGAGKKPPKAAPQEAEKPVEKDAATIAKEKARKKKMYLILGGVYGVVMIVGIGLLLYFKGSGPEVLTGPKIPQPLPAEQIEASLRLKFNVQANDVKAADCLRKAVQFFNNYRDRRGNLFRSVKYFHMYLAYKGSPGFSESRYEDMYKEAMAKLVTDVEAQYKDAYVLEKAHFWNESKEKIRVLMEMVPFSEEPFAKSETDNVLFENILRHLEYVTKQAAKK